MRSTICHSLSCVTHFDLADCVSVHYNDLDQLAFKSLETQQRGLMLLLLGKPTKFALCRLLLVSSHCHNLQGLNLFGIHFAKVEDHILLWVILSDMKLTHIAVEFSV